MITDKTTKKHDIRILRKTYNSLMKIGQNYKTIKWIKGDGINTINEWRHADCLFKRIACLFENKYKEFVYIYLSDISSKYPIKIER